MKAIRNLPNVKEIEGKTKHWNEVYKRLEACPLSLYGRKLNYRSAFRKANQNLFKGPYIYYGVATVEAVPEGFLLILTDRISVRFGMEVVTNFIRGRIAKKNV